MQRRGIESTPMRHSRQANRSPCRLRRGQLLAPMQREQIRGYMLLQIWPSRRRDALLERHRLHGTHEALFGGEQEATGVLGLL